MTELNFKWKEQMMSTLSTTAAAKNSIHENGRHIDASVVMPAYNERESVAHCVEKIQAILAAQGYDVDVIVVDDGSTDGTAEEAEAAGANVVRLPENRGYGAALKAGIAASSSEFVIIIDADGTYPAEVIPQLMKMAPNADMVVAARKLNRKNISLMRRPAKWFLTCLASYLVGKRIPDLNSGLRVMRRSVLGRYLPILPKGFSFTTTITLAMLCMDHRVIYFPTEYHPRIGSSKIRPTDFVAFLILVLRMVVLFNPLKVFLPLGLFLFLCGAGKLAYDIVIGNLSESAVMAFLAAIMIWSFGMLADMIGRLQLSGLGQGASQ